VTGTRTMIDEHLDSLTTALRGFAASADLDAWGRDLSDTLSRRGGRLIAAGNGGSAAHAQHLVTELVGRMKDEREPLPALALTADGTTVTALGNDYGFDEVFARQVAAHARPEDIVLLISTSGSSANVVRAAETAVDRGAQVWSFTGPHPNPLSLRSKRFLAVDSDDGQIVQEVHQVAIHLLCACLDSALFASRSVLDSGNGLLDSGRIRDIARITGHDPCIIPDPAGIRSAAVDESGGRR
jgi:D-sedoheptulose 7-phosphate isomerase